MKTILLLAVLAVVSFTFGACASHSHCPAHKHKGSKTTCGDACCAS